MELQTNPHNPRTISKDAYEKLKRSIERNPDGLTANKIAYKDGIIISGNQRYRAILELGLTIKPEWLKDLSGWTQEQIDEWVIQSNISAGEWDWDILANEWEQTDLEEWGVDTSQEWDNKKDLPEDIDEIPEVKTPISKLGDLWLLGNHRVLCGDSTDKTTVELLMDGKKADMVFTSPPYNGDTHLDYGKGKNKKLYDNDTDQWTREEYIAFCHKSLSLLFDATEGFIFWNVMYNAKSRKEYIEAIYPYIESLWETVVWKKTGMPLSNGLTRNYEFVFVFKNGNRKHLSSEFKTESNLWDISNIGSQDKQNIRACFPVALPIKGIELASEKQESVLDPFLGSGSTLIACEQTDRTCYGLELDPHYVDVICKRWQTLTGEQPILQKTQKPRDFIGAQ